MWHCWPRKMSQLCINVHQVPSICAGLKHHLQVMDGSANVYVTVASIMEQNPARWPLKEMAHCVPARPHAQVDPEYAARKLCKIIAEVDPIDGNEQHQVANLHVSAALSRKLQALPHCGAVKGIFPADERCRNCRSLRTTDGVSTHLSKGLQLHKDVSTPNSMVPACRFDCELWDQ